jgi:hypothetical protein
MGFFKGGGGGPYVTADGDEIAYVSKDQKRELAEAGAVLTVTSVIFEEGEGFEGGDRFVLVITGDAVEEITEEDRAALTLGTGVESRDQGLEALAKYLESNDSYDLRLVKVGRAFILEDVEEAAKPAAKRTITRPPAKPAARRAASNRGTKK